MLCAYSIGAQIGAGQLSRQNHYHSLWHWSQEYVASLIGLYKNNGAVSCVAINFLLIWSLSKMASRALVLKGVCDNTELNSIKLWADINRNCNTFFRSILINANQFRFGKFAILYPYKIAWLPSPLNPSHWSTLRGIDRHWEEFQINSIIVISIDCIGHWAGESCIM